MKKFLFAVFGICIIILLVGYADDEDGTGTFTKQIDTEQIIKDLNVNPKVVNTLKEKLNAVNQILSEFHEKRIQMEIIFTKEAGTTPRNQRRSIDDFTAEVLETAKTYQQRVNNEISELKALLSKEELEKFQNIKLPNLEDPGSPIFGMFRPPTEAKDREEARLRRNKFRGGDKDFVRSDLQINFNHDNHKERGLECVTCHETDDDKTIADAYLKPPTGSALMRRGPNHITEMGTCTACHDGETAPDNCSNCHPNWQQDQSYLSNNINKFEDVKVGMTPPHFSLKDTEGNEYSLRQYQGKQFVVFQFGSST